MVKQGLYLRAYKRISFYLEQRTNRICDTLLGIQSEFVCTPKPISIRADDLVHAQRYHASNYLSAAKALWYVRRTYTQSSLVDLGCGAGRILAIGARLGFDNIIGIDFDPSLVDLARQNTARCRARFRGRENTTILVDSVAQFTLSQPNCVIFLFNPFDAWIFDRFLAINQDILREGQSTFVCINPRLHDTLLNAGYGVAKEWCHDDFSRIVRVYRAEQMH